MFVFSFMAGIVYVIMAFGSSALQGSVFGKCCSSKYGIKGLGSSGLRIGKLC